MNLYEIVFSGQLMPGAQPELVQGNLGKLFQADAQRLALLFSGRRLVLKNNLDADAAEKYRSTLERAGAMVEVVSMQSPTQASSEPTAPTHAAKPGRLQVEPRDVYMAAFVDVDAPDLQVFEVGSDLQDRKPEPTAPTLDLSGLSLAPAGSDMGQAEKPQPGAVPDTSHLRLE